MNQTRLERLREIIGTEASFYRAVWTLRSDLFGEWQTLADAANQAESREDNFVAYVVSEIERFKRAASEKRVFKKERLKTLGERSRQIIGQYVPTRDAECRNDLRAIFQSVYEGNGTSVEVTERAAFNANAKPTLGCTMVFVDCQKGEELLVSSGLEKTRHLNFDMFVASEENRRWVIERYLREFIEFERRSKRPLAPCFEQKYAGVRGPYSLLDDFRKELPTRRMAVYSQPLRRMERWLPPGGGNGCASPEGLVLFGDVVVTGKGLADWSSALKDERVNGAVVLADYANRNQLPSDYPQSVVPLISEDLESCRGEHHEMEHLYSKAELNGFFPCLELAELFTPPQFKEMLRKGTRDYHWLLRRADIRQLNHKWIGTDGETIISGDSPQQVRDKAKAERIHLSFVDFVESKTILAEVQPQIG